MHCCFHLVPPVGTVQVSTRLFRFELWRVAGPSLHSPAEGQTIASSLKGISKASVEFSLELRAMAPKRSTATAASPKAKAVASPKARAKDKAKGKEAEPGLNKYFGKRKVSECQDSPKGRGACKRPAAVKSSAKPNNKKARKQEVEVETVKKDTVGSTNSTQSFQTKILENQGAPCHTQGVASCRKFDTFHEPGESIVELAEQKSLEPKSPGRAHPLGIALDTIPRPNLDSGPAQLCSTHHAHAAQEALATFPTFEVCPDLCGGAGGANDADVFTQSLAPPSSTERKIADAPGAFCDGARDACESGSPMHAESSVSATATGDDGAPLDRVLDVQPDDVADVEIADVERNSFENKDCHSDHADSLLSKNNHCSGQDGCGTGTDCGTDRPHDHGCSDKPDQQADKSDSCTSPHVCTDRKCEHCVKNTVPSVNQPGVQELDATERKRILTRMFRWPFSVMDILYNFVKHPLNHLVQKNKDAAVQVACSVRQHVHDALTAEATGTPSRMFGSEFSSAEPDSVRTEFFRELVSHIEGVSMSTCFSGVDTPATSYMGLAWAACREGGFDLDKLPQPRNMFAIEKFSKSIEQLEAHPHPAEHIFDDVEAFWSPAVAERLAKTQSLSEDFIEMVIVPAVLSGHAATDTAFCLKHKRRCKANLGKEGLLSWWWGRLAVWLGSVWLIGWLAGWLVALVVWQFGGFLVWSGGLFVHLLLAG